MHCTFISDNVAITVFAFSIKCLKTPQCRKINEEMKVI